jgi:hypothetical protein
MFSLLHGIIWRRGEGCVTMPPELDSEHLMQDMEEPAKVTANGLGVAWLAELLRLDAFVAKLVSCEDDRPPLLGLATSCKQLHQLVSHVWW